MQIEDLIPGLREMSTQELQEKIRSIRKNKYEVKPAKVAREKKAVTSKLDKALSKMKPEDIQALLDRMK